MFTGENLSNLLRAMASGLQTPVMMMLLVMPAVTLLMLGSLIAELFTERVHMKAKLPELADKLRSGKTPIAETIADSGLLKRQIAALNEIISHPGLTAPMRESLAVRLLNVERERYDGIVKITDIIARLGPMFGLLGTLIPLGPGIIALGQGDTYTLSLSMLTAFDTTIAGLISAAVAIVISTARKRWYSNYMSALEMIMECVLEVESIEKEV